MLSRSRKTFLEAGSGFHGNAFESWGEHPQAVDGCGTAGESQSVWS